MRFLIRTMIDRTYMLLYKFRIAKKNHLDRAESSRAFAISGRMIIINSIAACDAAMNAGTRTLRTASDMQWVNSIPPLMTTREAAMEGEPFNNPCPWTPFDRRFESRGKVKYLHSAIRPMPFLPVFNGATNRRRLLRYLSFFLDDEVTRRVISWRNDFANENKFV